MQRNKRKQKSSRKSRRSVEQQIVDLEAQLGQLKDRRRLQKSFDPKDVHAERERLGLSAKDYAALIGVAPLTIYSWEQGRSSPRAAQLGRWLGVRGIQKAKAYERLGHAGLVNRDKFSADTIYSERQRLELSARDYAELIGVSMLTVYNWEKGKSEPRKEQLERWLGVLGIGKRTAWDKLGY